MFSALRTRFGIPGVIATVALVFAMTGGAFAAKYLITSTKQISPSVLKKLKGATGPAGAAGAQGPAGAAGANGKDGANGTNGAPGEKGEKGTTGTNGTNGKSVLVTEIEPELPGCDELGGALVKVEGAAGGVEVCNGKAGEKGEKGEKGEDATFDGKPLKAGVTMTGGWSVTGSAANQIVIVPISFPIKLAFGLGGEEPEDEVHFGNPSTEENEADFETNCTSPLVANPTAPPGHLCVYVGNVSEGGPAFEGIFDLNFTGFGTSKGGALLKFKMGGAGYAAGSWAVTG